ncbi:MAG TPA: molybdenum cofactor guanylyltransferase [Bryobacteraceae bacterium]|nr:molybdenum cofactor guanylyltransferase [Bryobacteraceae bacterium]
MSSRAGFVLAGGASSRMGRDKALLPWLGSTLVEVVAARVFEAAGSVTLVGPPDRYSDIPIAMVPDLRPGLGPLAGIETALEQTAADWNLILACDMPAVTTAFLRELLDRAERLNPDCLAPIVPSGRLQPLCAVYHRRCLEPFRAALDSGTRSITDALGTIAVLRHPVDTETLFANLNTPADLATHDD